MLINIIMKKQYSLIQAFSEIPTKNQCTESYFKNCPQVHNIENSSSPMNMPLSFSVFQKSQNIEETQKKSEGKQIDKRSSFKQQIKEDQFMFQLKLKLISIIKKLNIDYRSYQDMKEEPIESILEVMFRKMKEYIRDKDSKEKEQKQQIKIKQIRILQLQAENINISEQLQMEKRNKTKTRQRKSQQLIEYQQLLKEKKQQIQKLSNIIYKNSSIAKEQSQYLRTLEKQHQKALSLKTITIMKLQEQIREMEYTNHKKATDYLHNEKVFKEAINKCKQELIHNYHQRQELEQELNIYRKLCTERETQLSQYKIHEQQIVKDHEDKLIQKQEEYNLQYELYKKEVSVSEEYKMKARKAEQECNKYRVLSEQYLQTNKGLNIKITQLKLQLQTLQRRYNNAIRNNTQKGIKQKQQEKQKQQSGQQGKSEKQKMRIIIEQWKHQLQLTVRSYEKELGRLSQVLKQKNMLIKNLSIKN